MFRQSVALFFVVGGGMEQRAFVMHQKLLVDVVKKQAGTLTKAIIEGVCNAIDAGAANIGITLTETSLVIEDDGAGFRTKEEIAYCFETFGAPHLEGEGKVFGQFRMGRGQLMAFGRNVWTTNTFRMVVDIDATLEENTTRNDDNRYGLSYVLTEGLDCRPGCKVEVSLYRKLEDWQLKSTVRELTDYVKHVKPVVLLNDQVIAADPDAKEWDIVTEYAYIKVNGGEDGLKVFNLGVFVYTNHEFGVSGEVVSRQQLDVNFARNQIISTCEVWRKIVKTLKSRISSFILNKKRLDASERRHIIRMLLDGEYQVDEIKNSPIFPDVVGRFWSANELKKFENKSWCMGVVGSMTGDRVMQLGRGIVLDSDIMRQFRYEGIESDFFDNFRLDGRTLPVPFGSRNYVELSRMLDGISETFDLVPEKQWTKRETLVVKAIADAFPIFFSDIYSYTENGARAIFVGSSSVASAWTDGMSYICVNRSFIRAMDGYLPAFMRLAFLILHEVCHDFATIYSHVHTPAFHQLYHDKTDSAIKAGERMYNNYRLSVRKVGKRIRDKEAKEREVGDGQSLVMKADEEFAKKFV